MTKDEILSRLCYYDKRNPNCEDDENIEIVRILHKSMDIESKLIGNP